jgi:MFS family permease
MRIMRITSVSAFSRWRRTGKAQTLLLGLVFFCVPGMWNSITSMAGGLDSPTTAGAATAAVYATYALTSLVAPAACSVLGPRLTLFIGTTGYSLYVGALLMLRLGVGGAPLVIAAGAINGCCAALLWVAHGVLLYTYAGTDGRGVLFGLFWLVFNFGAVCGGLLTFGHNFGDSSGGEASAGTFVIFLCLMALGSALCVLFEPAGRVIRIDGSRPPPSAPSALRTELHAMLQLLLDRRTLALAPLFVSSNWFYAYQFTCFNARLFDTRTQGLNNAFYWAAQMVGALVFGRWLDMSSVPPCRRAHRALATLLVCVLVTWALALWTNDAYAIDGDAPPSSADAPSQPSHPPRPRLDALRTPSAWALPFAIYVGWGAIDAFIQTYTFWMVGQLDEDPKILGRFTGISKCLQSSGAAVSWALSSLSWGCGGACAGTVPPTAQAWINVVLSLASLPGALWLAATLQRTHELQKEMVLVTPAEDSGNAAYLTPDAAGGRGTDRTARTL